MFVRQPPTGPASTPDPVPAWMAGAGSGVSPRQATVEARTRPAAAGRHRLPPDRTRGSIPILGERSAAPWSPSSPLLPLRSSGTVTIARPHPWHSSSAAAGGRVIARSPLRSSTRRPRIKKSSRPRRWRRTAPLRLNEQRAHGAQRDCSLTDGAVRPGRRRMLASRPKRARRPRRRQLSLAQAKRAWLPCRWRQAERASSSRTSPALGSARTCRHRVTTVRIAPRSRDGSPGGSYVRRCGDRVDRAVPGRPAVRFGFLRFVKRVTGFGSTAATLDPRAAAPGLRVHEGGGPQGSTGPPLPADEWLRPGPQTSRRRDHGRRPFVNTSTISHLSMPWT